MDKLMAAALIYQPFLKKEYLIQAGRKKNSWEIKLIFNREHFHHITGLQKLIDLPQYSKANRIFTEIIAGRITYQDIAQSVYIAEVDKRLDVFHYFEEILSGKIVLKFNPVLAHTRINADMLMYNHKYLDIHLNLFFKRIKDNVFVPYSFFPSQDGKFVERQERYTVLNIKINEK